MPYQVRSDLLKKHISTFPDWAPILEAAIAENLFIIIPNWHHLWQTEEDQDCDVIVYDEASKGPSAIFHLEDGWVTCVNYANYSRQSISEFLEMVRFRVSVQPENDGNLLKLLEY